VPSKSALRVARGVAETQWTQWSVEHFSILALIGVVCHSITVIAIYLFPSNGMTEVDVKITFSSYPHLPTKPLLLAVKRGMVGSLAADMQNFIVQEIARKYNWNSDRHCN